MSATRSVTFARRPRFLVVGRPLPTTTGRRKWLAVTTLAAQVLVTLPAPARATDVTMAIVRTDAESVDPPGITWASRKGLVYKARADEISLATDLHPAQ